MKNWKLGSWIFICLTMFSCNNENREALQENKTNTDLTRTDTIRDSTAKKSVTGEKRKFCFTDEFTDFLAFLDSTPFNNSDTVRLKKIAGYPSLKRGKIFMKEEVPFYLIDAKNHEANDCAYCYPHVDEPTEEIKKLKKYIHTADSIIGYFRTHKDSAGKFGSDIAIEIWKFKTEQETNDAMKAFKEFLHLSFFNTGSIFVQNKNHIYILTTRSAATLYGIKKEAKRFKEILSPDKKENSRYVDSWWI